MLNMRNVSRSQESCEPTQKSSHKLARPEQAMSDMAKTIC